MASIGCLTTVATVFIPLLHIEIVGTTLLLSLSSSEHTYYSQNMDGYAPCLAIRFMQQSFATPPFYSTLSIGVAVYPSI